MAQRGTLDIVALGEGHTLSIAYSETGNKEGPLLLFVHGLGAWRETWMLTISHSSYEGIRARYRIVAIDLPGFGDSGSLAGEYCVGGMAIVVAKAIEALGEESAIVVGNSLGGSITLSLALNMPERVRAIVVQGPPIAGEDFSDKERAVLDWWMQKATKVPDIVEDLPVKLYALARVVNPFHEVSFDRLRVRGESSRLRKFAMVTVKGSHKHSKRAYYDILMDLFRCKLKSRLGEIRMPMLAIDGFPAYGPADTLDEIDELVDDSCLKRIIRIQGAGHLAPFVEVEAFAGALDSFLIEVESELS